MGIWLLMAATDLVIPAVMIGAGRLFWKRPPRKLNGAFGYRSALSMRNGDTWDFAHRCAGRLWWKLGWVTLALTLAALLPLLGRGEKTVGIVGTVILLAQCVPLAAVIPLTERALERTFHPDGTRKNEDFSPENP